MTTPDAPSRIRAYVSLAAGMALVGSYVGLSRLLVGLFPVFLLAWLRFGIAGVAMLPWLRRAPGEMPLGARDRRLLFWESFLGNFLFSVCMLYGVALTSAVSAGVVMAALPGAVALLSRVFLGERLTVRVGAGIALAMAGVATLAVAQSVAGMGTGTGIGAGMSAGTGPRPAVAPAPMGSTVLGHMLLGGAVLCEASYVVIGKQLAAQVSARRISALVNLWGWVLVTPLGLWQAARFDFTAVPGPTWGLLTYYALAASVASVWLWMKGLARVPAPQAGVFTVMLPITAALVGCLWLGESFGAAQAVAFALALGGLLLASWPRRGAG